MGQFSAKAYEDSLARKYYGQLGGAAPTSAAPSSGLRDLIGAGGESVADVRPNPKGKGKNPTNPVGWALDILSRPAYAAGQTARETQENLQDGFDLSDLSVAAPGNFLQNLFANEKELPSDVLLEKWAPEKGQTFDAGGRTWNEDVLRFGAGLGLDIALDPLTYVPGAAFVKGAEALGKVAGFAKKAGPASAKVAKELPPEVLAKAEDRVSEFGGSFNERGEYLNENGQNKWQRITGLGDEDLPNYYIGNERIPESRQITAGPERALPAVPSESSAPRTFEMGNERPAVPAPAPEAPARTFIMELAEDTKAVAAAKKVTKGKFVPKPTPEAAAEINAARVAEGIEQPRVALRSVKTGETVPFSQRLANLSTARKQYPDLDVVAPFKAADEIPAGAIDDIPAQAPEVVASPTSPEPSAVISPKDWAAANGNREITLTGGKITWLEKGQNVGDARVQAAASLSKESKGLTLKEILKNPKFKPQVAALYREEIAAQSIAKAPAASPAPVERSAATEAARHRSEAVPALVRYSGPEWEVFKNDLKTKVSSEDYTKLIRQKKPETFAKVLEEMKSRKIRTPLYVPIVLDITPESMAADVAASVPEGMLVSKRTSPKTTPLGNGAADQAIINEAKTNLPTATERMPTIAPENPEVATGTVLSESAGAAVFRAIHGQQWDGVRPDFQWRTSIQESLRNSPVMGKGQAVNRNSANVMFQTNMYRGLMKHWSAQVPAEISGMSRADWLYKNMMPDMRAAEEFLRSNGIMPVGSILKEGYPIGLSEVIDGLWKTGKGREFIKGRIFDTGGISPRGLTGIYGTIDPTSLMGAAHLIAEHLGKSVDIKDAETLRAALNKIIKPGEFRTSVEKSLSGARGVTSRKGPVPAGMQAAVVKQGADLFMQPEVVAHIFDRVMENTARYGVKFNTEVAALSNEAIQSVVDILREPLTSTAEAMHVLTHTDEVVEGAGKAAASNPEFVDAAKEAVRDTIPDVVKVQDIASANNRIATSKAAASGDTVKVREAATKTYTDDVAAAHSAAPATLLMNLSDNTDLAMQAGIMGKLQPLALRFNPAYGNATLHSAITTGGSVAKLLQKQWRHELSIISREHSREELGNAIKWLQAGHDVTKAPSQFQAAAIRLKPVMNQIFETDEVTGTSGVLSAFFREGFNLDHINEKLKYVYRDSGLEDIPQFKPKTRDKKVWVKNTRTNARYQKTIQEPYYDAEVFNQWRGWNISKDPLDFMARMETTFAGLATDMAIAQEGFRIASSLGYASKTQRQGFVQLADQEFSTLARYMPKGSWFDPQILGEIKRMDEILAETTTLNSGFGRFVNQYLDPILNMWKSGMTVWRPGHHVRNFIGDSALSYYAHGVSNPQYYYAAARMQVLRGEYDGWNALQALQGINRVPSGNAKDKAEVVVKIGRGNQKFTDRDIFQGLMDRGMLPDFRVQEDLIESGNNPAIQKLQQRMAITGGRAKAVVGRISEARDDTVRIAHALHLLENGLTANPRLNKTGAGYKSLEDALDKVAKAVKKYHPDGADLTGFERTYMRRLMPFYSWSRKAFPLIAEAMLTQPGRVIAFPKAMLNYAESQGIDVESLSNPFPDDQLFPSFLEDRSTGPVFQNDENKYFGIAPGMPAMDILDDFVGNPKGGVVGMLNPFLKAPAELATGHSASTGAEIYDIGEYVDSQIPGVSTFSSMAGISTTGTPWSILSGNGLDEQRAVVKGNKGHFDPESILNYLTGIGAQNFSKQSYINSAELEQRDRVAAEKARAREK